MATLCPDRLEQVSGEPAQPSVHTIEDASKRIEDGFVMVENDAIEQELIRIVSVEPGRAFIEKEVSLQWCRFYRPAILFFLCFAVLIVVISVFVYAKTTGIHETFCAGQSRKQLLIITWMTIVTAIAIGVIGCIIIFAMPTTRKMMNWLLKHAPTKQCELSEEDKKKILPKLEENRYLHLRLAGSAGDGFGCFFGQNGNIGLTRKVDFCQDLDLNIVFNARSDDEYSLHNLAPGFVTVNLNNKEGVLRDMIIDQECSGVTDTAVGPVPEEKLMSGSKIIKKMKSVLEANMGVDRSRTIPPAQRIERDILNSEGKKHTIQYDYVFSLASVGWPAEACDISVLQIDNENNNLCYVVPKPWADATEEEDERIWRYSFTEAEAELFKLYNKHHKILIKCYIILKFIIKFEDVSRFPFPIFCCKRPQDKEIVLKTYFLKMIFLHIGYELESRRIAEEQLLLATDTGADRNVDVFEENYQIYCDPEELETTLSNRISPLSNRMVTDGNLMENDGVFIICRGDRLRLMPAVSSNSFLKQSFSTAEASENSNTLNKRKTMDFDAILVLILNLYITAMDRQTLMHFFVRDLNLLRGFTEELCNKGSKALRIIKLSRLARVLDFQDFWASRTVLHLSYLAVIVALVVLISLVCVTIYGSVWLMNRDINNIVCPVK